MNDVRSGSVGMSASGMGKGWWTVVSVQLLTDHRSDHIHECVLVCVR